MKKLVVLASVLVLAGTVGASALPVGSAPSFARAKSYSTGELPNSAAIGDLNGDGTLDVVTANEGSAVGSVSVLLNSGDGTFRRRRDYRTGDMPQSVAIRDLNGDANPDLVTANWENTVSVLTNVGDGSFQAKHDFGTGSDPHSVAIGDLNADGSPDLVTANGGANAVSVLLNRGDGSFQAKHDYAVRRRPSSVAIGDLNGDGKPDLVIANSGASTVSVLLNSGDGSFQAGLDYRTGPSPVAVATGDLNGDGNPDLATARLSGIVSVLLNAGDGRFHGKVDYKTGFLPASVALGDLNGDGRLDVVSENEGVRSVPSKVSTLLNRGDGSFQPKLDYGITNAILGPNSVAIGDLNRDGKADLVTSAYAANSFSVLINTPGLCTVQDVSSETLQTAKRTIAHANCRVGKIRRTYSKTVKRGRVISQKPKFGAVLSGGSKVNLVVSRGRRSS